MEERAPEMAKGATPSSQPRPTNWRDLREWLDLVNASGRLKRVIADQSIRTRSSPPSRSWRRGGRTRRRCCSTISSATSPAPACWSTCSAPARSATRWRSGSTPRSADRRDDRGTRTMMRRRLRPAAVARTQAPVNEVVLREQRDRPDCFPAPKFWPGDGGRYIGTGDITLTSHPDTGRINVGCYRQMLHGPRRVGLYCSPGKHGGLDRDAWWARGKPCEVVAAYGVDPVLFMLAAQVFGMKESELDVAGGMMGRAIELTDAEYVSLPIPAHAELVVEGAAASRRYRRGRSARRIHRLLRPRTRAAAGDGDQGAALSPLADSDRGADGQISLLRDRRLLRDHAVGCGFWTTSNASACRESSRPTHIRRQRPDGAWLSCRCSSNMPATRRRSWRSPRSAPRRRISPSGSSSSTKTSILPTSTKCCGRSARAAIRRTISISAQHVVDRARSQPVPPEARPYGSKVLINACKPHRHLKQFPPTTLLRRTTYDRVAARWRELGFSGRRRSSVHSTLTDVSAAGTRRRSREARPV